MIVLKKSTNHIFKFYLLQKSKRYNSYSMYACINAFTTCVYTYIYIYIYIYVYAYMYI